MDCLKIHLFGGVEVFRGEAPLPPFPTQKAQGLFAYLVLARGRPVARDTVCGRFWGDQPAADARKALRTCLWRIRSVVEPREAERGTLVTVEGDQIGFSGKAGAWVDAWEFEDCLKASSGALDPDRTAFDRLERAAALYRGDLLEGHQDEWCFLHRERLRLAYLTVLERLVAHHEAQGRWLEVIARGQQLLRHDPWREHIHGAVMEAHLAMGDRPSALRQFELCARLLREELDIEPMEETRGLYRRMRAGHGLDWENRSTGEDRASDRPEEIGGLAAEVDGALTTLYALTERLEKARSALAAAETTRPGAGFAPAWRRGAPMAS